MRKAIPSVACLALVAGCGTSQGSPASNLVCGNGTQLIANTCVAAAPDGSTLSCGPGTVRSGDQCVLDRSGVPDAGPTAGLPVGDDAGTFDEAGSQATNLGIDAAHHNAQPLDAVRSPLTPVWTLQLDGPIGYPLIVHGLAIIAAAEPQPNVRALDLETGKLVWGPVATGYFVSLAYEGGSIFALDRRGSVTAFDALTGKWLWATHVLSLLTASFPVAWGGAVYVLTNGAGDGITYAFDQRDGRLLWYALNIGPNSAAVAAGGGVVYEADGCHVLSAFDAITGRLNWIDGADCGSVGGLTPAVYQDAVWERDISGINVILGLAGETRGQFRSSLMPAFHAGTAFYLATDQTPPALSAFDIATATVKWIFSGNDYALCTSPVVAGKGGQVFVGSLRGILYELDEATGAVRSVSDGVSVSCGNDETSLVLGAGHLLVKGINRLVAY